jgi:hypothetical protein
MKMLVSGHSIQPHRRHRPTFRRHVKYECLGTQFGTARHAHNHVKLTTIHILNITACPTAANTTTLGANNEQHLTGLPSRGYD